MNVSYTPDEQLLERHCHNICDAIDGFIEAATSRMDSGEYETKHEDELVALNQELTILRLKLKRLGREVR